MTKALAWLSTWALFWAGHWVSRLFLWCDYTAFMYPIYNWLMCNSCALQDEHGIDGPWGPPASGDDA